MSPPRRCTFIRAGSRTRSRSLAPNHIDADFYESVRYSLEYWWPRISPGGYVKFDDYGAFIGCNRAVDEFLATRPELKLDPGLFIQVPKA